MGIIFLDLLTTINVTIFFLAASTGCSKAAIFIFLSKINKIHIKIFIKTLMKYGVCDLFITGHILETLIFSEDCRASVPRLQSS